METNFEALPTICRCGSVEFTVRVYLPVDLYLGIQAATWRLGTEDPLECVVESACSGCGARSRPVPGATLHTEDNGNCHNVGVAGRGDAEDPVGQHTMGITRLLLRELLPAFGPLRISRPWYTRTRIWKVERV